MRCLTNQLPPPGSIYLDGSGVDVRASRLRRRGLLATRKHSSGSLDYPVGTTTDHTIEDDLNEAAHNAGSFEWDEPVVLLHSCCVAGKAVGGLTRCCLARVEFENMHDALAAVEYGAFAEVSKAVPAEQAGRDGHGGDVACCCDQQVASALLCTQQQWRAYRYRQHFVLEQLKPEWFKRDLLFDAG